MAKRPVSIFGRVFLSMNDAFRTTGITLYALAEGLNDPDFPDFQFCDATKEEKGNLSERRFNEKVKAYRERPSKQCVVVFGKVFPTALQASRETDIPYHTLRRKLKDQDVLDFQYCGTKRRTNVSESRFNKRVAAFLESLFRPSIYIFGRVFSSVEKTSRTTGIPREKLMTALDDPAISEIRYCDGKQEKGSRVSERQLRAKVKAFRDSSFGSSVLVFGKVFKSARTAAVESGIEYHTLRKWLRNPDFPEIRYHDGKIQESSVEVDRQFRKRAREFRKDLVVPAVSIFGKVFRSARRASKELDIPYDTIRKKIRDPEFPEFRRFDGLRKEEKGTSEQLFKKKIKAFRENLS